MATNIIVKEIAEKAKEKEEDYSATIKIGVPIVLGQLGIVVVGLVDNIMV